MFPTKCLSKPKDNRSVALVKRLQLGVVSTYSYWFKNSIFSFVVLWSCEVVQQGVVSKPTADLEERRIFPWFTSLSGYLEYDCWHVQFIDILHVLWAKGGIRLMLPFILLAGCLWGRCPVCSHAAVGVTCGDTASVEFTDLDSRRRHT